VWLFHRAITEADGLFGKTTSGKIHEAFNRFEGKGRIGQRARTAARLTRKSVWNAWRKAKSVDPERWNSINFFKSSWGIRKTLTLALPKCRTSVRALTPELTR
jgi:hypothetical protein